MAFSVVFVPEALEQLQQLFRYIAKAASTAVATRYTDAVVSYCESLTTFPERGIRRDDIRPGLRITHHQRTIIAFVVKPDRVVVFGIFHGGQNYSRALRPRAALAKAPRT